MSKEKLEKLEREKYVVERKPLDKVKEPPRACRSREREER